MGIQPGHHPTHQERAANQTVQQILDKTIENLPAGIVVKDIQSGFKYLYRNRESYNRNIPP